ncbi:DUF6463 family protein [Thermoactinospora rubra]|uniref:DUF6463 family protein n=1 Tax=Thermoactinospora rubra TaxID=1088767 RepID=UPI00117BF4DB|nr:DUF6463 family protein [Thermoactinospora rubra]
MSATATPRTGAKPATLTTWGGWGCVAIGLGHSALGTAMGRQHWAGWLAGDLHGGLGSPGAPESKLAFWAVPGGFAIPLILLGLLAVGRAREGRPLPRYVGWTLLAWAVFGAYVMFPTFGFFLVFVPAALFLLDGRSSGRTPAG